MLGWLAAQTIPEPSKAKAKEYYGWHPNNPAKSASAIAATTAAATGVPQAASALLPAPTSPPEGDSCKTHHCMSSVWYQRKNREKTPPVVGTLKRYPAIYQAAVWYHLVKLKVLLRQSGKVTGRCLGCYCCHSFSKCAFICPGSL